MAEGLEVRVMGDDLVAIQRTATTTDEMGVFVDDVKTGLVKSHIQTTGLDFDDFTDGGSTTGYLDLSTAVPLGSLIIGWRAITATGFTGDTTAVLQVGVSGDVNRFTADVTQAVLGAGTITSVALAVDAGKSSVAATTVRLTVTGGADFTSISAGSMTSFEVFYI